MPEYVVAVFDSKDETLAVEREVFEGMDVELRQPDARDEDGAIEAARDADAIIADAAVPITERLLSVLDLRIVARAGIGFDNIDVAAAGRHGVTVTNVPDYCVDEVSTHALALLLALVRKTHVYASDTAAGGWDWERGAPIRRLGDLTLGIVAFGRIGSRAAEKALPFFERVIAADPYVDDAEIERAGVEPVAFDELLARANVISIHTPLTDETRDMFDADAFAAMDADPDDGGGTLLVNTSRGPVVDEDALLTALDAGTVAGAGLDVMEREPPGDSPLLGREDVIVTPHVAWYSRESQREVRRKAATEVRRALEGEDPRYPVGDSQWL